MKFSIKDFFSKCHQIRSFPWIWSHLLKKSLMEKFTFCAVVALDIMFRILCPLGFYIQSCNRFLKNFSTNEIQTQFPLETKNWAHIRHILFLLTSIMTKMKVAYVDYQYCSLHLFFSLSNHFL